MDTEKEDRRLLQSALTRETIKDTFLKLLSTMSFSKIRVTNICSEAHITRTTFYYHYCDIFKLVDDILQDIINILSSNTIPLTESLQNLESIIEKNDVNLLRDHIEVLPPCHRLIHIDKYHSLLKEPLLSPYIIEAIYKSQRDAITEVIVNSSDLDEEKAHILFWYIVNGSFAVNQKLCWTDGDDYYKIQMVLLRFILGGYKALFSHNSSSNNVSIGKLLHTSSLTAFDAAKDDSSPKK